MKLLTIISWLSVCTVLTAQNPHYPLTGGATNTTITEVSEAGNPFPTSTNTTGLTAWATGRVDASPHACTGVAHAFDQYNGSSITGTGYDWDYTEWSIRPTTPANLPHIAVSGNLSAGGFINLISPTAAGVGSVAHSASVTLAGDNEGFVNIAGAADAGEDTTPHHNFGAINVEVSLGPLTGSWTYTPTTTRVDSGAQVPIIADTEDQNELATINCSDYKSSCTLTIHCGAYTEAFADGSFWYLFGADPGESSVTIGSTCNLTAVCSQS